MDDPGPEGQAGGQIRASSATVWGVAFTLRAEESQGELEEGVCHQFAFPIDPFPL